MNKHREAEKNIKLLVSMTKGLAAIVPDLERAGSFERLIAEGQERVDALRAEEDAAIGRLGKAEGDIAALLSGARKQAEIIIEQANAATREAEELRTGVDVIIEDAKLRGKAIEDAARATGDETIRQAQERADALEREVTAAEGKLADVRQATADAEAQLAGVNAELERVRAFLKA